MRPVACAPKAQVARNPTEAEKTPPPFFSNTRCKMPTYSYRCANCGAEFDHNQSYSEAAPDLCPKCGEDMLHRLYKPVRVIFKGAGFYATDHKSPSGLTNGKSENGDYKPETPARPASAPAPSPALKTEAQPATAN